MRALAAAAAAAVAAAAASASERGSESDAASPCAELALHPPLAWDGSLACAHSLADACAGPRAGDAECAAWNSTWVVARDDNDDSTPVAGLRAELRRGCAARTLWPAEVPAALAPAVQLGPGCAPGRLRWEGVESAGSGQRVWAVHARAPAGAAWDAEPLVEPWVAAAGAGVYAVVSALPRNVSAASCARVALSARDVAERLVRDDASGSLESRCADANADGAVSLDDVAAFAAPARDSLLLLPPPSSPSSSSAGARPRGSQTPPLVRLEAPLNAERCGAAGGVRGRGKCALTAAARPVPLGARALRVLGRGGDSLEETALVAAQLVRYFSFVVRVLISDCRRRRRRRKQDFGADVSDFVPAHDVWAARARTRLVVVASAGGTLDPAGWVVCAAAPPPRALAAARGGAATVARVLVSDE